MRYSDAFIAALNAASLALSYAGQAKLSGLFDSLARAAQSGLDIDAQMQEVADKLRAGPVSDEDLDDVLSRIRENSERIERA